MTGASMTETGLALTMEHPEKLAIPKISMQRIEQHPQWPLLSRVPLRLAAAVPVAGFKVKDLLALELGKTITTAWSSTDDVPVRLGTVQLCWSEFEVVEGRMAVRLTRLA